MVLQPLPVPAANQLATSSSLFQLQLHEKTLPSLRWLGHSERVWYETLGRVWQWFLGIKNRPILHIKEMEAQR